MTTFHHPTLVELGQAASQVLHHVRKMAARGDSRQSIESYLEESQQDFLQAAQDSQRFAHSEIVEDVARALRYARPNAELVGTLAVLATVSQHSPQDFRSFSLAVSARARAELRDHSRLGLCDLADIKLGVEIAMRSVQPLAAA